MARNVYQDSDVRNVIACNVVDYYQSWEQA